MIIFLGAGASRTFGIPTTKEFISLFEKEVGSNDLYRDVKAGIGEDQLDLESLMSVIDDLSKPEAELLRDISPYTSLFIINKLEESGVRYYKKANISDEAKQLLQKLKNIIKKECFRAVTEQRQLIVETYDEFFSRLSGLGDERKPKGNPPQPYPVSLHIFTTNYDTCLETYFGAKRVDFINGIELKSGYNVFNVDAYTRPGGREVEICKLHGSIDLFKHHEDIRHFPISVDVIKSLKTHQGEDLGVEFMVWPIESSGARHVIQSPHLDLYKLFRDRLTIELRNDRPVWLLVGSSFRDLTITSIMNDVLKLQDKGGSTNVIFIDPQAKASIARIEKEGFTTLAKLIHPLEGKFRVKGVFNQLSTMG